MDFLAHEDQSRRAEEKWMLKHDGSDVSIYRGVCVHMSVHVCVCLLLVTIFKQNT